MKKTAILILASLTTVAMAQTQLLWDNGEWQTNATKSVRIPSGDFGWPVDWLPNGTFDSAIEDFTVSGTDPWDLSFARFFLYESGATNTNLTISNVFVRLWNTQPSGARLTNNSDARIVGGSIFTGATADSNTVESRPMATSAFTGVFRVTSLTDTATTRPIWAVDIDLSYLPTLNAGTYWMEVSAIGSTAGTQAWVPVFAGTTPTPNSRAMEIGGGNYINANGAGVTGGAIDFAYELHGNAVPEPGSMIALGLGLAAMASRRRRR